MGMRLDYESGKTVIGHRVSLVGQQDGHAPGMLATLVAAYPAFAEVKPRGHGKTERLPWEMLRYASGANRLLRALGRAPRRGKL